MSSRDTRTPLRADAGFTMIELLVTISVLVGVLAIAVTGWVGWARASAQQGTAQDIQSVLRQAQQRAVTEASSLCVLFDTTAGTWRLYRGRCESPTKTLLPGKWSTPDSRVQLTAAAFTTTTGTSLPGVSFTSRGTASPGSIQVTRTGASEVLTVSVEGLTGRVSTK